MLLERLGMTITREVYSSNQEQGTNHIINSAHAQFGLYFTREGAPCKKTLLIRKEKKIFEVRNLFFDLIYFCDSSA